MAWKVLKISASIFPLTNKIGVDQNVNDVISLVRGKIEAPYGWVKQRFSALSKPFYEDEEQHDNLVLFAFTCH
jgi:hypothetical protein